MLTMRGTPSIQNKSVAIEDSVNVSDNEFKKNSFKINRPKTKEAYYYRKIFDEFYDKNRFDSIIPEFWMPSWSESDDPSARNLSIYKL